MSRGKVMNSGIDGKHGSYSNSTRPIIPEALPGWSSADSTYEHPLSPFPQDTTHTYALSVCTATGRGHASTPSQERYFAMLCYTICYAMLCYAMICYAMLYYTICYAMLCYAMPCLALLCSFPVLHTNTLLSHTL